MGEELLSLRWNNHQSHFVDILTFLREQEIFIDVTLACGGKLYPAHKFVLSTCSDYFKQMFTKNPNKHPIVFMKDVLSKDLEALLDFMYHGEVNVPQSSLGSLIKTAEGLQIKGLAVPDDPPLPRKENNSKEKRDLKARDHSYSPAPKRLKAREKSPSVNSNSHNNSQRRSSVCENNLSADAVDEDSRTSAQSTVSDSVNAKSNLNSHSSNHEQDNSLSENINPLSSTEPAAGPSGLQRSKEEQVEIKQEEEVVDLDDDDSWNRFEGNGDEGMDDSLMGNLGSDNTPNFSDLLNNPSDVHPLNPSNDPAMTGYKYTNQSFAGSHLMPESSYLMANNHFPSVPPSSGIADKLNRSNDSSLDFHYLNSKKCDRPFTCPFCSYSFKRKYTLQEHIRIHLGHKPYSCSICGKSFTQSGTLGKHMRLCHSSN